MTENKKDHDEDVVFEKRRIDHGDCKQDKVFVRNLHKVLPSYYIHTVYITK